MWKVCYISRGYLKKIPLIFVELVMKRVDKSNELTRLLIPLAHPESIRHRKTQYREMPCLTQQPSHSA